MLDLLEAILTDRFVLLLEAGAAGPPDCPVDLRDEQALAEELTSPWSPGRGQIFSWGGTADRPVTLETLEL